MSGLAGSRTFDEEQTVGLAIVHPSFEPLLAWLAFLHVSRPYRRRGAAQALWDASVDISVAGGAESIYVSAAPTESAVGFYLRQGCRLTETVHPELFAAEPEDIHLVLLARFLDDYFAETVTADYPCRSAPSVVAAPGILDPETAAVDLLTELLLDHQQRIRPRLALRARHHRPIGVELRRHLSQATHSLAEQFLLNLDLVPFGDAGQVEGHGRHSNVSKKTNPKSAKPQTAYTALPAALQSPAVCDREAPLPGTSSNGGPLPSAGHEHESRPEGMTSRGRWHRGGRPGRARGSRRRQGSAGS